MTGQKIINQQFNAARWRKLVALHWEMQRKRYLLAVPAMLGLLLLWFSFILLMSRNNPMPPFMQEATYYTGLLLVGSLFASSMFSDLGSRTQGIAFLSIPASALEKLLCAILFSGLVFFAVYNIIYYAVDITMVNFANRLIASHRPSWPDGSAINTVSVFNAYYGEPGDYYDNRYHINLLCYFIVQSAFLLGSVYFEKYAFIKTTVTLLIFLGVILVFHVKVVQSLLPVDWSRHPFLDWVKDRDTPNMQVVRVSPQLLSILGHLLIYGPAPLMWLVTWFRLKEKQV
jgi:hypothetical protein